MTGNLGGSAEMQILYCALALGLLQLVASVLFNLGTLGIPYNVSPRDETRPLGKFAGRTERAFRNFLETFVFFAAAVLLANALGKHTTTSALGAEIYIWARLIYVPLYMLGIPYLRTLTWTASIVGIVMVMAAIWPGV